MVLAARALVNSLGHELLVTARVNTSRLRIPALGIWGRLGSRSAPPPAAGVPGTNHTCLLWPSVPPLLMGDSQHVTECGGDEELASSPECQLLLHVHHNPAQTSPLPGSLPDLVLNVHSG